MSRRGVAACCGLPEATIRGWIQRGMAEPSVEPWGSFAEQYRRAERGLELAAASTVAMTVTMLHGLSKRALAGEESAMTALAKQGPQMKELLNVLAARYPADWGTSKHRTPEPEYTAEEWLDDHALTHEQLGALFADPPEPILKALVSRAPDVYALLLAHGFDPSAQRKAEDETGGTDKDSGERAKADVCA